MFFYIDFSILALLAPTSRVALLAAYVAFAVVHPAFAFDALATLDSVLLELGNVIRLVFPDDFKNGIPARVCFEACVSALLARAVVAAFLAAVEAGAVELEALASGAVAPGLLLSLLAFLDDFLGVLQRFALPLGLHDDDGWLLQHLLSLIGSILI